ncbi:hypothetical protein LAZ67_6004037 [Cordylochernes scorpioides]|uniref:HTH CENPB-type domain-containing protein n=1 Tax=Cordylochernes scorpioides TaxID=51811 RepID=A0ABY6KMM9_9ARAC|nr:hypothetical protein LAZ67_6004037 [Cordylochernes scorpioides]
MAISEPKSAHLREVLLFAFNWKKSATEAHRMLEEVYSDHALSKSQCYRWFKKFQSGDFELDNEPHGKPPQKFEDVELQALLDDDSTQMQEKLANQLQVSQGSLLYREICWTWCVSDPGSGAQPVQVHHGGRLRPAAGPAPDPGPDHRADRTAGAQPALLCHSSPPGIFCEVFHPMLSVPGGDHRPETASLAPGHRRDRAKPASPPAVHLLHCHPLQGNWGHRPGQGPPGDCQDPSLLPLLAAQSSTLKRDRGGEFPDIEEALFRWIRQANAMKLAINGNILKEKAILLALKVGQDNFETSNGWLEKFKARRNIAFKRLHGEAGSVDANSVATWKGEIIPSLLAKYSPQDIFNADETGLFYKLLPNQTMTIRGEKCEGGKKSKERILLLRENAVCCNMDGSEKLPLLYIGKYRRPRCFHGMNIPSNYHFNTKVWMTGAIFTDWLKKLDQIFKRRERKMLLILYNCPAHQIPEGLQNIEIRFLPALTTSALQPCDMGIIKALKDQYRKRMITYLLTCMEEKKCSSSFTLCN